MEDSKTQLINKLRSANHILATVSRNPSVDQLSALLGLTLYLNKQGKHAAAVFSGEVPSALEFLQPDETIEKNTDSLRDFIIALDKSKADKLRYKVEDDVVRIFITPYKTSISEDDFDFSQGDFNVDVVVALGVQQQEDLDEAITAHGRILHDATVTSLNVSGEGGVGSIVWHDPNASSLSELVTELAQALGPDQIDEQIATALLTGIVSETERFSNDKTSPQTMSMSALLMGAGANQQLVASKLEEPVEEQSAAPLAEESDDAQNGQDDDGMIEIDHSNDPVPSEEPASEEGLQAAAEPEAAMELPEPDDSAAVEAESVDQTEQIDPVAEWDMPDQGVAAGAITDMPDLETDSAEDPLVNVLPPTEQPPAAEAPAEAPVAQDVQDEQPTPVSVPPVIPAVPEAAETPEVTADEPAGSEPVSSAPEAPQAQPPAGPLPEEEEEGLGLKQVAIDPQDGTLMDLEESVQAAAPPTPLDTSQQENIADQARDEINKALNAPDAPPPPPQPTASLNAQPLGDALHETPEEGIVPPAPEASPEIATEPTEPETAPEVAPDLTQPAAPIEADQQAQPSAEPTFSPFTNEPGVPPPPAITDETAPPPVPPPMTNLPPQVYQPGGNSQQQQ